MKWASAISTEPDLLLATAQAAAVIQRRLAPDLPDTLFVFVSPRPDVDYQVVINELDRHFPEARVFGCTASGVIGDNTELEHQTTLSLTGAVMPDVQSICFHADSDTLTRMAADPSDWWSKLDTIPEQQPIFIVLADPFSVDTSPLLQSLDQAYPDCTKVGGLASGGQAPGEHALLVDHRVHQQGAAVLALFGDVHVDALVAQGCRAVGAPMTVTSCDDHFIHTLDGHRATDLLQAQLDALSPADRALFQQAPQIGLAIDPIRSTRRRGDYLVRNLVGVDPGSGHIAVGATMAEGLTVQLHVRDSAAAEVELDELWERHRRASRGDAIPGALLFSCLGRGEAFYGAPNHDSHSLSQAIGPVPTGGMFCNGEIGPIHARTWLHNYTSVFALFRPRGWS